MKRFIPGESTRFILPVIAENLFTAAVSLVYSSVTGAISASALAAVGVGNQALNLVATLFAMLSTGSAIITARRTGEGDAAGASRTVEQTLFLAPVLSVIALLTLLASSTPAMKLLMPGAEGTFLREGTVYFRTLLLSLPALVISNACAGVLRASGDSKNALVGTVITNVVQLALLSAFTSKKPEMGVLAPGLATLLCRCAGGAYLLWAVLRQHRSFRVSLRRALTPDRAEIRHILSVGLPACLDSFAVQLCYVVVNSLLVSLGKLEAGIVNVLNAVLIFTGVTQGMGSAISMTLVGQSVGAGDIKRARKRMHRILLASELVAFALCVPTLVIPDVCAGFFTKDADILRGASEFMWIMFPYCFAAVGVNVCEPSARAGGSMLFTMAETVLCVWLIRLPLTYLLCIVLGKGVKGIYWANISALSVRFALSFAKIHTKNWGTGKL
ncbi:MAG: MATE family efflux transporter [Clostridia bacterium]|nr:MATE family efflux transporter [Clostridia bacterium]